MDSTQLPGYFTTSDGSGILSTADSDGQVNSAVYAKPRFFDDGTIAFIMLDRLNHHNLQSNPHAAYLFLERGDGYRGIRLKLTKLREELNTERIEQLLSDSKHKLVCNEDRYLVFFNIDTILPLVIGRKKDQQDA
ncbi:MAG: pyridoxamine 5'-phosphate oxidase family protein [Desulfuromonas sp.]|nr:pyridoxamine 5'-phosphate oxidase family protein [Desulfuromonas sp.]